MPDSPLHIWWNGGSIKLRVVILINTDEQAHGTRIILAFNSKIRQLESVLVKVDKQHMLRPDRPSSSSLQSRIIRWHNLARLVARNDMRYIVKKLLLVSFSRHYLNSVAIRLGLSHLISRTGSWCSNGKHYPEFISASSVIYISTEKVGTV